MLGRVLGKLGKSDQVACLFLLLAAAEGKRIGDLEALPSVADSKIEIARAMRAKMEEFQREVAEREEREKRDT